MVIASGVKMINDTSCPALDRLCDEGNIERYDADILGEPISLAAGLLWKRQT